MPYRNKDKQRKAVREAVRRKRESDRQLKKALEADVDAMRRLYSIPKAYKLIFGKTAMSRKKKKKRR